MGDADYLMALELQKQFDDELNNDDKSFEIVSVQKQQKRRRSNDFERDLNNTCNLVHPEWETLDPTPDAQALMQAFDDKFFKGKLKCVTLEWSKRMYSCAGICYSRRNRLGMAITIRLSEPLLKLRSRKDLVETLLHEMIHAYCSVLGIREGNGGHGPNFKKIMHGINQVAGTNITVYHTFHDEVDVYKTHWWRCNGICQNRKPFFGFVKRTSNRAPGPNDTWWQRHLESCGGTFLKVREPESKKTTKRSGKECSKNQTNDLRKYFHKDSENPPKLMPPQGAVKSYCETTVVTKPKTLSSIPSGTSTPIKSNTFGNLKNVVGFKDLTGDQPRTHRTNSEISTMSGAGYSLTTTSSLHNKTPVIDDSRKIDKNQLRDIWSKKFPSSHDNDKAEVAPSEQNTVNHPEKKRRISSDQNVPTYGDFEQDDEWQVVDDEIMIKEENKPVIDISSDDESDTEKLYNDSGSCKPILKKQTSDERQKEIKQEIMETSGEGFDEDDIEIIDDDYDDNIINISAELADTALIDDLFGEDTLLKDFRRENAIVAGNSRYHTDPMKDIVTCPVCQDKLRREDFSNHLDGCIGISIKVKPSQKTNQKKLMPFYKKTETKISPSNAATTLKNLGYESDEIADALNDESTSPGRNRRLGLDTSTHACPVCAQEVEVDKINDHLDICLQK